MMGFEPGRRPEAEQGAPMQAAVDKASEDEQKSETLRIERETLMQADMAGAPKGEQKSETFRIERDAPMQAGAASAPKGEQRLETLKIERSAPAKAGADGASESKRGLSAEALFAAAREALVADHPFLAFPLTRLRAAEAGRPAGGEAAKRAEGAQDLSALDRAKSASDRSPSALDRTTSTPGEKRGATRDLSALDRTTSAPDRAKSALERSGCAPGEKRGTARDLSALVRATSAPNDGSPSTPDRAKSAPGGAFASERNGFAPSPGFSSAPRVFPAGTDGARFFIAPDWNPDSGAAADMLFHSLTHCLRGHPFDPRLSALACDLDAALWTAKVYPERCPVKDAPLLREARSHLRGARDAASIQARLDEDDFLIRNRRALEDLLTLDDHGPWDAARRQEALRVSAGGEGLGQRWRRDAQGLGEGRGRAEAGQRLNIALAQGARQDFTGVLRRYASLRENARDDPDSFQYGWYAYGLEHYGNVPLIEPLEYREEHRIDRLAIAIDTSGSCARGLTQRFLELTRDILATEGLFFRRFCLHILQCDARVQRDDRIETLADFERYIRDLTVIGGGGTDFRPAFERVDALVASGELRGLKGMLYFSDGRGIFPSAPPKYDVTFVFLKYRYDAIDVPAWVRTLVLDAPKPQGGESMDY